MMTGQAPTTYDMGYYSHYPVLARALAMTTGPVLELGMGWGSTPLLHAMCANKRDLISFETDPQWLARFQPLAYGPEDIEEYFLGLSCHQFELAGDWKAWMNSGWPTMQHWSVVFIDCAPGEIRKDLALKLKDHAEFVILHDAETDGYYGKGGGGNYRYYEIDHLWKYKEVYRLLQPATLILSDTRPFGLSKFEQGLAE